MFASSVPFSGGSLRATGRCYRLDGAHWAEGLPLARLGTYTAWAWTPERRLAQTTANRQKPSHRLTPKYPTRAQAPRRKKKHAPTFPARNDTPPPALRPNLRPACHPRIDATPESRRGARRGGSGGDAGKWHDGRMPRRCGCCLRKKENEKKKKIGGLRIGLRWRWVGWGWMACTLYLAALAALRMSVWQEGRWPSFVTNLISWRDV